MLSRVPTGTRRRQEANPSTSMYTLAFFHIDKRGFAAEDQLLELQRYRFCIYLEFCLSGLLLKKILFLVVKWLHPLIGRWGYVLDIYWWYTTRKLEPASCTQLEICNRGALPIFP